MRQPAWGAEVLNDPADLTTTPDLEAIMAAQLLQGESCVRTHRESTENTDPVLALIHEYHEAWEVYKVAQNLIYEANKNREAKAVRDALQVEADRLCSIWLDAKKRVFASRARTLAGVIGQAGVLRADLIAALGKGAVQLAALDNIGTALEHLADTAPALDPPTGGSSGPRQSA